MKKPKKPSIVARHTEEIADIKKDVDFILRKVSANGRPGLENSLQDIYREVKGLRADLTKVLEATETSRAWSDVRISVATIMKKSLLVALFRHNAVKILSGILSLLFFNSLLHAIGVGLDVQSILRLFRLIP